MSENQSRGVAIIAILKILKKHTDKEHSLSQHEIQKLLESEYEMNVDRKTVRRNLSKLMKYGFPIHYQGEDYGEKEIIRKGKNGTIFEHNITLLSIAMREGEKVGKDLPKVKVDDSMVIGQAYLLTRLAKLVQSTNEELRKMNETLRHMAITDGLTDMMNRREIERCINNALDNADKNSKGVGLIMVDVDHFKRINDLLGHDVGDKVLKKVASVLKDCADPKKGEAAGRWGGEEFFMLFPNKTREETSAIAEETRKKIEESFTENVRIYTASFGVIHGNCESDRKNLFIKIDEALYQAKAKGRNCVVTVED